MNAAWKGSLPLLLNLNICDALSDLVAFVSD